MGVKWTEEQQKVIELQKRNILVSAAAGSGKTAVLVERIIQMVTRKENPIDIDRLLIVTFTRAAAGEMRERIGEALEQRLQEEPENEHLQRQATLLHHAQINTIHGFCSYVIRNYFHKISLDPGYRMANEGELELLKKDVVGQVLECAYEEAEPDFLYFVECYASGKTDEKLEELILKLYEFSMSYPWPREWLLQCQKQYDAEKEEDLEKSTWMKLLWDEMRKNLQEAEELTLQSIKTAEEPDGPYMYLDALQADLDLIAKLQKVKEFQHAKNILDEMTYARLSAKKDLSVSENKKNTVKNNRDEVKGILGELKEKYFCSDLQQILRELHVCKKPVSVLVKLTERFMEVLQEKKKEKNLLDFSDLEHLALEILLEKDGMVTRRSAAARELSDQFEEIMIDEYQDSNYVQEQLLTAVSRMEEGQNNIFMVGDVKQSIYRFRLARPELFLEKYHLYTEEESKNQKIDLRKNFRSRAEVLQFVNYLFYQIMTEGLGGVSYDRAAALYPGAVYEEGNDENFPITELLLLSEEELTEAGMESRQSEAILIGNKIKEIVDKELIWDKKEGQYRKVRYRDIVILLRTVSGWSEEMTNVLQGMGIPSYGISRTGYFTALEVVTVLNYLQICDNPRQEIPFEAVLHSPIGGCSAEELALIKIAFPEQKNYEAVRSYILEGENRLLAEKLRKFLELLDDIRGRMFYTPIQQLLHEILEETGYGRYAASMPGGEQREANLRMLEEKAMEFEGTSYRGLYHFIRYIRNLQKYQVDFGEVNINGENTDAVRIMSIHKSKGLEFPVVFAAGMGKHFNQQDSRATLILHSSLGIGVDAADPEKRVRSSTRMKEVMKHALANENLGEELRILYVALTRAKEKLILTGCTSKLDKKIEKCHALLTRQSENLSYGTLARAGSYLDWILPALARHPAFERLYREKGLGVIPGGILKESPEADAQIRIEITHPGEQIQKEIVRQMVDDERKKELLSMDMEETWDKETEEILQQRFSYQGDWKELEKIPVKMTVSELKLEDREQDAVPLYPETEEDEIVPRFICERKEELHGAARGTAYHRFFQYLDYGACDDDEQIREQLDRFLQQKKLRSEEVKSIRIWDVQQFVRSELGIRMKRAFKQGSLYREQPFVIEIPASEADPGWVQEEQILVQGMIDAYFEEEDGLVLVDYKTDWIRKKEELIEKYGRQLKYYAMALERLTGKKVKERILYSVTLSMEIPLEM